MGTVLGMSPLPGTSSLVSLNMSRSGGSGNCLDPSVPPEARWGTDWDSMVGVGWLSGVGVLGSTRTGVGAEAVGPALVGPGEAVGSTVEDPEQATRPAIIKKRLNQATIFIDCL